MSEVTDLCLAGSGQPHHDAQPQPGRAVAFSGFGRYSQAMSVSVLWHCTITGTTKRTISMSITDTGIIRWPAGPGVC